MLLGSEVESAQAFFEKAAIDVFETFKFFALGLAALLVGCVEKFKELIELVATYRPLCSFLKVLKEVVALENSAIVGKKRKSRRVMKSLSSCSS